MSDRATRLQRVGFGIGMIYAALCLILLSVIGIFLGGFLELPVKVVVVGCTGAILLASILSIIGQLMCLAVPPDCRGANYICIVLGLVIISILAHAWEFLSAHDIVAKLPKPVTMAVTLIGIIASILFLVFLRLLSEYIERPDLAELAKNVLLWAIILGVLFAGCIVAMVIEVFVFRPLILFTSLVIFGVAIKALVIFCRYAYLLNALRKALIATADPQPPTGAPVP